jgi:beta propeller repeat protein
MNPRTKGMLALALVAWISSVGCSHHWCITEDNQSNPAIYGDIVVWEDERNGDDDIYGYNLEMGKEVRITTDPYDQSDPAIYGDYVVWTDRRNGNADIYGYTLSTQEEFQITKDPSNQQDPAIHSDIVVWTDKRNGNDDIYGFNLETGETFRITEDGFQVIEDSTTGLFPAPSPSLLLPSTTHRLIFLGSLGGLLITIVVVRILMKKKSADILKTDEDQG